MLIYRMVMTTILLPYKKTGKKTFLSHKYDNYRIFYHAKDFPPTTRRMENAVVAAFWRYMALIIVFF